jgi:hypothetical protein
LAVAALFGALHQHLEFLWRFWLFPLRSIADLNHAPAVTLALAFALALLVAWGLASLAFRRSVNAGGRGWAAAAVIVPIIQILVIVVLSVVPARAIPARPPSDAPGGKRPMDWRTAI